MGFEKVRHIDLPKICDPRGNLSFLEIDDGVSRRTVTLNRSNIGLYVAPGIWVGLRNFSSGSVCLTLASDPYDEADYVRDYDEFLNMTANKRK